MEIKYQVIRDSREQNGWDFTAGSSCEGTIVEGLKTGDYSIKGYEHILTIERKGSISELAHNLVQERFDRELERMEFFKYSFLILEFNMEDLIAYPKGSSVPPWKRNNIKLNPFFLLKRLLEIEIKFKVKVIFAGKHGKTVASSIFKRVIENEQQAGTTKENN